MSCAEESLESAASRLQEATVTVRVTHDAPEGGFPSDEKRDEKDEKLAERRTPKVSVCTGVLVEQGWVVTSALVAAAPAPVRLTFPDGAQATCRVRVVDEYSGLALLQFSEDSEHAARALKQGLALSDEAPSVGSWVLSAAAWGAEQPVVSLGVVSGHDRTLRGATYPPLLQCDLRSAVTSSGAAVVNAKAELLGVVVASESANERGGWTYAVPASHVHRLQRTVLQADEASQTTKDPPAPSVIVLKRLRPTVGMILEGNRDQVVVKRVVKESPADRAGIQAGDEVLEAAGVEVRSVYQAIRPVLYKQPGDVVRFRVRQIDGVRHVDVVLGGGVALERPQGKLADFVQPRLDVEGVAPGIYRSRSADQWIQQFTSPDPMASAQDLLPELSEATAEEKLELLQQALDGYRKVILYQQEQLRATRQELESLKNREAAPESGEGEDSHASSD